MVFAGGCSYGLLSTFVKLAYKEGYNTAELSFLQALTGLIILSILLFIQNRRKQNKEKEYTGKTQWWTLLLAGASIGLTSLVYYHSVKYIPASVAIIILMQFTWIGILLDWLLYGKTPTRDQIQAIVLILIGTTMAGKLLNSGVDTLSTKGLVYAFGSALFFALYVVISSRIKADIQPLKKSAIMMLSSATVIFILNAETILFYSHFDIGLIKWILFLALFGTIIPPLVFSTGIPKVGVGYSSILMTAELPVAVICSQMILKEQVNLLQWAGIILILLSIIWLNLKKQKV